MKAKPTTNAVENLREILEGWADRRGKDRKPLAVYNALYWCLREVHMYGKTGTVVREAAEILRECGFTLYGETPVGWAFIDPETYFINPEICGECVRNGA